jgi:hypothetical protein
MVTVRGIIKDTAAKRDRAGVRSDQPRYHPEQGALARAAWPHHCRHTGAEGQVNVERYVAQALARGDMERRISHQ